MAKNSKKGGSKPSDAGVKEVPLVWVGVAEHPVEAVNKAYSQFDDDGLFVLTLGLANPPVFMGGKERNQKILDALELVTVTTVARLAMTEGHAESLMKALQTNLKQYRARKGRKSE